MALKKVLVIVLSKRLNPRPNIKINTEDVAKRIGAIFQGWTVEAVQSETI